ncbi:MAG: IS200/IS605 family element transposase accessory protein TnpB [Chloroflexi bacterium]|nr:IS200/IS605 family element transposase accessory protein TnpB [Chloroflexota bacterium]
MREARAQGTPQTPRETASQASGKSSGVQSRRKKVRTPSREAYRNTIRNRNVCNRASSGLGRRFGRIAVEDLRIRNMTRSAAGTIEEPGKNVAQKTGLNRSITEQTWGMIHHQLAYKAKYAGRQMVKVGPAYTSKTCSDCGVIRTEGLETYRLFDCHACGLVVDRDLNAARNKEARAFGYVQARGNESAQSGIAPHAQLSELSPVHAERQPA